MITKYAKDLQIGDKIKLIEPQGIARITSVGRSKIFQTDEGYAYEIKYTIISGHNKGKKDHGLQCGADQI